MPATTNNPQPGKRYEVRSGDTLRRIAQAAYGDGDRWREIWARNETNLRSDNPNRIFPGETIYIPELAQRELPDANIDETDPNRARVSVDGYELPIQSGRLVRKLDSADDGLTVRIPWTPGNNPDLDRRLIPYAYPKITAYLGGSLQLTGRLYTVKRYSRSDGVEVELEAASYMADLVDSQVKPPYEHDGYSLVDIARRQCEGTGIQVVVDDTVEESADLDPHAPISRATAEENETKFEFLRRLSEQYGMLMTSDRQGRLLISKARLNSSPVDHIIEGKGRMGEEFDVTFDGRERFSSYRAVAEDPQSEASETVADPAVPGGRFYTFRADEAGKGGLRAAATYRRNKSTADALTLPVPVSSWYNASGKLWEENTIVTIESRTLGLPNGFDMLIRQVEFIIATDGASAILSLVPPQVYSGEDVPEPWES